MKKITIFLMAALVCSAGFCASNSPLKKKVLIVMLDGLRADAIDSFQLPTLMKLRNGTWQPGYKGAWTDCARTISDAPAHSAPNHAAIATGVTAKKHHVTVNGTTPEGNWKEWPSWQHRLVLAQPDKKVLFIHAWSESGKIDPTPLVPRGFGSDWVNSTVYPKKITEKECPDAIMYYINAPDGGGHGSGYYPYGTYYPATCFLADQYLKKMLDLVSKRSSFPKEDWLILVTADHGGYGRGHGQPGGQSDTVPLIVAGRDIVPGRISGSPCVTDLPVTALEFFGVKTAGMNLDGKVITQKRSVEKPHKLNEALAAHFIFSRRGNPVNRASCRIKCLFRGKGLQSSHGRNMLFTYVLNCSDVKDKDGKMVPQGLTFSGTEKLQPEDGKNFTVTFWYRGTEKQPGDSVILGNKLQSETQKTGFFISAARKTFSGVKKPGIVLNFKDAKSGKVFERGTYDVDFEEWSFYALSVTQDGIIYFVQGKRDGRLYWFVEDVKGSLLNGNPWYISQSMQGNNQANLTADIDDFCIWNRGLSLGELRTIFEAGRNGRSLMDLIQQGR